VYSKSPPRALMRAKALNLGQSMSPTFDIRVIRLSIFSRASSSGVLVTKRYLTDLFYQGKLGVKPTFLVSCVPCISDGIGRR
jgi:hypothetical protein